MEEQEFFTKLGHKIQILRKNNKISQEKLAECVGLDRVSISNAERGKAKLNVVYLKRIADKFGVQIAELFNFMI